jgi:hypothetical protein
MKWEDREIEGEGWFSKKKASGMSGLETHLGSRIWGWGWNILEAQREGRM